MSQTVETKSTIDQVFDIDQDSCIRCASCSSIAPTVFFVGDTAAHILRQPINEEELNQCEAALGNCPTSAISVSTK
ncbi:MAG TPA: ferredoxin [Pyrinomonadaceae bacterium]|nr:ferredoxin [Pyrinomonadaceae bacterium]